MNKVLSDERLGAKLRVTENRCVLFNSLTYIYIYIYRYIYLVLKLIVIKEGLMKSFMSQLLFLYLQTMVASS